MKLLSITTDPTAGGSSKSLLNMLCGLKTKGVEIGVILPKEDFLSNELKKHDIKYFVCPGVALDIWPALNSISDYIKFIPRHIKRRARISAGNKEVELIVKSFSPDLIHTNVSLFKGGYKCAIKMGIPHLWHIREYGVKDFNLRSYPTEKRKYQDLAQSETISITKEIKEHFRLGDKCHVVYNGIKSKDDVHYIENKNDRFLYVGKVTEEKGVTDLIEAYILYRKSGGKAGLDIVGSYLKDYKSTLDQKLAESGLSDIVSFIGQSDKVDEYMQHAKALIVPSKYEAFGRTTAEGMFNGCLVIGRNTGGTKEQFDLGREYLGQDVGLRFFDIDQLKERMKEVDSMQKVEIKEIVNNAQRFAIEHFSTEQNVEKIWQLIRECGSITKL